MAYSETDLQQLEEAIAKLQRGERVVSVAYENHAIRYAEVDLKDLCALRDRMKAEVQGASSSSKRRIQLLTSKGI